MQNLKNESLIVSLSIGQWTARKLDRQITDEVKTNHSATEDAGRYNKLLVAKEHTEAITKAVGAARTFHYDNTLPWGDNNERLLSSKNYFKYVEEMMKLKMQFDEAVNSFFSNYDAVIAQARVRLNSMFRDSDYPSKAEIESKFRFRTLFMPVPDNDIRVGIGDAEVDKLKIAIQQEITDRLGEAVKDIWKRIKETVGHLRDKMSQQDAIFRDSLFENLKDLIELLPALNVTNDPNIDKVCNDMQRLIAEPDAVRNNPSLRATKAQEAEEILKSFKDFF